MRTDFPRQVYAQRWQVESLFSRFKRRLGSHLRATSSGGQYRQVCARALAQNLTILKHP